jgi:steroid 5-alpha reductase family enzyme
MAKTGKPLLEKDMASRRPGYTDYVARTSGFVPRPPRRRVTPGIGGERP